MGCFECHRAAGAPYCKEGCLRCPLLHFSTEQQWVVQILLLAQRGAIEALVASLSLHPRQEVILVALDGLHNMLVVRQLGLVA